MQRCIFFRSLMTVIISVNYSIQCHIRNFLQQVMERFDEEYFMKWFTSNRHYNALTQFYEDLAVA